MERMIFKGVFGSRLYGLENENSDWDYKGLFLPPIEDLVLQKAAGTSSYVSDDKSEECQLLSLQNFINLMSKGEMTVLDMIHTPKEKTLIDTEIWSHLRRERARFYTKNMRGYFGYIMSMVHKYNERSERLRSCEDALKFLGSCDDKKRLGDYYDKLPPLEYARKYEIDEDRQEDKRVWEVIGKKLPATVKIEYAKEILQHQVDNYGQRAYRAKGEGGVDWKAVCHAFRACYQMLEILDSGDLVYPLKERGFLLRVKSGQENFQHVLGPKLDDLVKEVKDKLVSSTLPEKVDKGYWDNFILDCYGLGAF